MMKLWIERRVTELLGFEDEVVSNFAVSQIEEPPEGKLCPK